MNDMLFDHSLSVVDAYVSDGGDGKEVLVIHTLPRRGDSLRRDDTSDERRRQLSSSCFCFCFF